MGKNEYGYRRAACSCRIADALKKEIDIAASIFGNIRVQYQKDGKGLRPLDAFCCL